MCTIDKVDFKAIDSEIIDTVMNNLISRIKESINTDMKDSDIEEYLEEYLKKYIKAFNLFLSSNPNYLYNKTYILDLIDKFKENINTLNNIKNMTKELSKQLPSIDIPWCALVDDYFIITYYSKDEVYSYAELAEQSLTEKLSLLKNNMYKFINCNILYDINENNHTVRLFCDDYNRLFSFSNKEVVVEKEYNFSTLVKQISSSIEEIYSIK